MGAASDAQIYNNSEVKELAEGAALGVPRLGPLPNDFQDMMPLLRAMVPLLSDRR